MKTIKTVRTIDKVLSVCCWLILMVFVSSNASVLADQDADDAPNYGVRGNRITSDCVINGGVLVIPQVPPPPTLVNPAPCQGLVTTLDQSPSSRWSVDISWFDPETQNLYLADRNNGGVDVFDTKKETAVGLAGGFVGIQPVTPTGVTPVVANNSGPNGILVVNNGKIHQLWAGDGVQCAFNPPNQTNTVTCSTSSHVLVYNLDKNGVPTSNTPFVSVDNGGQRRADELAYDPDDQLILIANDDDLDLFLTFISVSDVAGNIQPVGKISLPEADGCGIEQPVYDHASNRFYLAVPCTSAHTSGAIYVINPGTKSVEKIYDTIGTGVASGVPCFPHGLALGPRQNLLLGCSGDGATGTQMISIIMKATTGAVLQTFNQLGGSDEVYYNKGDNKYYLAMSSWTSSGKTGTGNPTPSLGIIDAGSRDSGPEAPEWIQNILTTRTSHSVAAGFGFACDRDDQGRGDDKHSSKCDDIVRKHAYVPLTTVPIPLSGTATLNETGGIGIYGRLP
jgi:hypothetical protein